MSTPPKSADNYVKEPMGRPSKFTPERRQAIIDAISKRVPYEFAAEANGICEETLYEWLRTAKEHRKQGITSDFTDFSEAIKQAELSKIVEHNEKISSNVDRWQADAWMLERRWYKHFGTNAPLIELNKRAERIQEIEENEKDSN